ncbi:Hypothetical_protein [Hexamita inflata]|uniref:Hypothetical_protein n=1 Tax=Hexamita inflata TaxID=28002 RepID=A0ABP1HG33_9EUKA
MNQLQTQLKLQLQKQLQTEPELLTYNVMMLSDKAYKICFVNASLELNMNVNKLQLIFQNIVMQELVSKQIIIQSQKIMQPEYQRPTHRICKRFTDFEILFEKSIQKVLLNYGIDECENSYELCRQINMCLQLTNKKNFWGNVQQLIPEKTDKQLREYYQKSFQRLMYESLTDEDDIRDEQVQPAIQEHPLNQTFHSNPHTLSHYQIKSNQYSYTGERGARRQPLSAKDPHKPSEHHTESHT